MRKAVESENKISERTGPTGDPQTPQDVSWKAIRKFSGGKIRVTYSKMASGTAIEERESSSSQQNPEHSKYWREKYFSYDIIAAKPLKGPTPRRGNWHESSSKIVAKWIWEKNKNRVVSTGRHVQRVTQIQRYLR
jgi:hypothetical protein